ncbi:related to MGS1-Maintenance of Genome Stability 1 [Sporisorium reilianum f. sp. reilianum]|uniref:Related to MGS1-Maintenance of Genome Stability 1 n=1 Tax=Sporisorium reilianum f. sp. reilianum TaxID=72559 RepID=A0A2N8UHL4_9BASI|nr:related to MGS1-Maintenance of Genome Stability 1 [Sporisorium reilianum f. sp. reilianum]
MSSPSQLVECPSCQRKLPLSQLNPHLDRCLAGLTTSNGGGEQPVKSEQWSGIFTGRTSDTLPSPRGLKRQSDELPSQPHPANGVASANDGTGKRIKPEPNPNINSNGVTNGTTTDGYSHANQPPPPATSTSRSRIDAAKPFAERMRPQTLQDYVGQSDVVNGPLKMLLRQGKIPSMILWGPPGTGKTTLVRLLAKSASPASASSSQGPPPHRFVEISATNSGTADVKKIMDEALHRLQLTGQRTLLFIDEIQRFSRAQQDVFLPAVEKGQIVLVAATTENPSFRLQSALISRMRVFVLTKLSVDECCQVLRNALKCVEQEQHELADSASIASHIDEDLMRWIANMADGDARTALGALELALSTTDATLSSADNLARLKTALKRTALQYDRTGDMHYDTISALHKSIRGSDPDAALYWLARMVCSGDDALFIARRLIVAASEDVDTLEALQMATATYHACQVVGLPECGENLAQCVVYLAEAKKSTRSYRAWKKAKALVEGAYNHPVPLHIRNAPTKLMKDIGYGKEYRYEPRFAHPVHQEFFPEQLRGTRFLSPPPDIEGAKEQHQDPVDAEANGADRTDYHHTSMQSAMPSKAGVGPGSCQRMFELGARSVDLDLLDEWEQQRNGGKQWSGRPKLMQLLERLEAQPPASTGPKDE